MRRKVILFGLLVLAFAGTGVVMTAYLANPFAIHIPTIHRLGYVLSHHPSHNDWQHLVSYLPWIIWFWLGLGFAVQYIQVVTHHIPRRVPLLGVSQRFAAEIIDLASASGLSRPARTREVRLSGVVEMPRDLTLAERSEVMRLERTGQAIPRVYRHQAKTDKDLVPSEYRAQPDMLYWIDTAIRHLSKWYAEQNRPMPIIRTVKVSDTVSVRSEGLVGAPPPGWDSVPDMDGFWMLPRMSGLSSDILSSLAHPAPVLGRLLPVGEDENGIIVWSHRGETPFSLSLKNRYWIAEQSRWLALVPWLDQIVIIRLGDKYARLLTPAHHYVANQKALVDVIRNIPADKVIIVFADQPCLPTGPFANNPRIIWQDAQSVSGESILRDIVSNRKYEPVIRYVQR